MMLFSQTRSIYIRKNDKTTSSKYIPWVVCLISALFFLYEFIQINMFSSIDPDIMHAYGLNSTGLGFLSSVYFYSTVAFLLPAGQILDRYSPKKVIMLTMIICIIGISGFALTTNIVVAGTCRLLEGIGSAFCFLGSFRIVVNWFPKNKITFISGLIVTIGMLGGVIAQTPLTMLISKYGWRTALLMDSLFGITIIFAIYSFVHDAPSPGEKERCNQKNFSYWNTLKLAYFNKNNWACGLYTCLMNSPIVLLGALWGSLYLEQAHHFTRHDASVIISMIFIGTIIGSPFFGFLSSMLKSRKTLMAFACILTVTTILGIMSLDNVSYIESIALFLLLGIFSSAQVLGYSTAAQNGVEEISAMSASVVSFTTMSGYIILQPLFGLIMDSTNKTIDGLYTLSSYHHAFLILPLAIALSGVILIFVKEPKIRH